MNKIIVSAILIGLICLVGVSALSVDIYYSESCPHCQKYIPSAILIRDHFQTGKWTFHDVNREKTNINSVPTTFIKTDDDREITVSGNRPEQLFCEIQEMSTKDCVTHSASSSMARSWFVWQ